MPYDGNSPIFCPGGGTDIDFFIRGAFGQFDILVDGVLLPENTSIEGGTVNINTDDLDGDGIPDGFVQLNTNILISNGIVNPNFWPDLYNECDGATNTIFVNIEGDPNLNTGDLIGAFYVTDDGSLQCFGYNEYVASFDGSSFFTIEICEGEDNGFYDGEEIVFLFYDAYGEPNIFGAPTIGTEEVYEVEVVYDESLSTVFNIEGENLAITSLSVVGIAGSVPDFTLTAVEGSYNIEINRTDSIDSNGDGSLNDVITCSVLNTTIVVDDPPDFEALVTSGGTVCDYLDDNGNVVSEPGGFIELLNLEGGTPPYDYTWLDPNGNEIDYSFTQGVATLVDFDEDGFIDAEYLTAGVYTLNIIDDNGCFYDTTVEVISSDIQLNELEIDYLPVPCLGDCDRAPVMMISDDLHRNLTPEKINQIISDYQTKA